MSGVKVTNERPARPIPATESVAGDVDDEQVDWEPTDSGSGELDQWKQPVRAATTANITIATALNAGDSIDGVTLAAGDRVLVKDQSSASQNGIYLAGATPERAVDLDEDDEVLGAVVYVIAGTVNGGTSWAVTNDAATIVDTDAIDWAAFGGGGGSALTVKDEGTPLATAATSIDFVGAAVVASGTGAAKTVTVSEPAAATVASDLAAHLVDATDAHDASAISLLDTLGKYTAADVEAALAELFTLFVTTSGGGRELVHDHGSAGSTEIIDLADGNHHSLTLNSATCALSLTGTTSGRACGVTLYLTQDGTGDRLVDWPVTVVWPGGSAPVLSTDPNVTDVITLVTIDDATTWYGFYGATPLTLGDTVVSETTFDLVADAGDSPLASRANHTHGTPPEPAGTGTGTGTRLLIGSAHGNPLVFSDILQASDANDFLYASE